MLNKIVQTFWPSDCFSFCSWSTNLSHLERRQFIFQVTSFIVLTKHSPVRSLMYLQRRYRLISSNILGKKKYLSLVNARSCLNFFQGFIQAVKVWKFSTRDKSMLTRFKAMDPGKWCFNYKNIYIYVYIYSIYIFIFSIYIVYICTIYIYIYIYTYSEKKRNICVFFYSYMHI